MKYVERPIEVRAVQFTPRRESVFEIARFANSHEFSFNFNTRERKEELVLKIKEDEEVVTIKVNSGDYVVMDHPFGKPYVMNKGDFEQIWMPKEEEK